MPGADLQAEYGVRIPADATGPSYGELREWSGRELWVSFGTTASGVEEFLGHYGRTGSDLRAGLVVFTPADSDLAGWDPALSTRAKGIRVPARDDDQKSPSQKIEVDYSSAGAITVYVLSMKG